MSEQPMVTEKQAAEIDGLVEFLADSLEPGGVKSEPPMELEESVPLMRALLADRKRYLEALEDMHPLSLYREKAGTIGECLACQVQEEAHDA